MKLRSAVAAEGRGFVCHYRRLLYLIAPAIRFYGVYRHANSRSDHGATRALLTHKCNFFYLGIIHDKASSKICFYYVAKKTTPNKKTPAKRKKFLPAGVGIHYI